MSGTIRTRLEDHLANVPQQLDTCDHCNNLQAAVKVERKKPVNE
jgi:hypothetical protein